MSDYETNDDLSFDAPLVEPEAVDTTDPDALQLDVRDGRAQLWASGDTPIEDIRAVAGVPAPDVPEVLRDTWDEGLEANVIGRAVTEGLTTNQLKMVQDWYLDGHVLRMGDWPTLERDFREWAGGTLTPRQIDGLVAAYRRYGRGR
jgi:hypothetical protein